MDQAKLLKLSQSSIFETRESQGILWVRLRSNSAYLLIRGY